MTPGDFSKAALDDCQLTVRALDVKCGACLVLLLAPLASTSRIFETIEKVCPLSLAVGLGMLFFLFWGLSLISLLRALAPLDNPASHISDHKAFTGAYYRGGLYNFHFIDALLKRSVILASKRVEDAIRDIPRSESDVERELTFEHMKMCYIRDIKIRLLNWGIGLAVAWLLCGTVIYLLARYAR